MRINAEILTKITMEFWALFHMSESNIRIEVN